MRKSCRDYCRSLGSEQKLMMLLKKPTVLGGIVRAYILKVWMVRNIGRQECKYQCIDRCLMLRQMLAGSLDAGSMLLPILKHCAQLIDIDRMEL